VPFAPKAGQPDLGRFIGGGRILRHIATSVSQAKTDLESNELDGVLLRVPGTSVSRREGPGEARSLLPHPASITPPGGSLYQVEGEVKTLAQLELAYCGAQST
jgi:hypothetical protein